MTKKTIIITLFCMFFAITIAQAETVQYNDNDLQRLVVGTWILHKKSDVAEMYGETEYQKNGRMVGKGYVIFQGQQTKFEFEGKWAISAGRLYEMVDRSNTPELMGTGIDRIISIDQNEFVRKDEDTGEIETFTKKQR